MEFTLDNKKNSMIETRSAALAKKLFLRVASASALRSGRGRGHAWTCANAKECEAVKLLILCLSEQGHPRSNGGP